MGWAFDLVRFGWRVGLKSCLAGRPALGLKSILNPIRSGYNRYFEFAYLLDQLEKFPTQHLFDLGSPKHLALFLGSRFQKRVTAVDIQDDFLEPYTAYAKSLKLGYLSWQAADGKTLPYPDHCFDGAYSISVLEHIPGKGDSLTAAELKRVLRKKGVCILTLPFAPREEDIFWNRGVYERDYQGKPNFFCRLYNNESLQDRIIRPSGLKELDRKYFTQTKLKWLRLENPRNPSLSRLPWIFLLFLHPFGPLWAKTLLTYTEESLITQRIPGTVCLTLIKE